MTEGIQIGISEEAYRAAEGVNQTNLKLMAISAAHYKAKLDEKPEPPTDAQKIGTITHQVILQDRHEYAVRPTGMKFTTKEGMAWRDAQTKTIISRDEFTAILGMRQSVMRHPIARSILERKGDNEVACFRRDPETGLMLKGRADRITTDDKNYLVIPDLKTCQHGEGGHDAFERAIYKYAYHLQAAFYLNLFGASHFVFIVVEKESPYAVATYALSQDAIALGRRQYRDYLLQVKRCTETGVWPAYPEIMQEISIPEWALRKEI